MDDYRSANSASLARLNALLDRLGPNELAHRLANGWTIADVLVHLAFWDAYALSWLHGWQQGKAPQDSTNIDSINAAITSLSRSIPLESAGALARKNAEIIDHALEDLNPALVSAIEASGQKHLLFRCWHRDEHLQTLERELA
ncbi:DinB family protein [Telmatobacter bradus]|uniref:DinB family protein n=1 Tax=Telmatobacter bradus TaxID=474953 RepID=UPI003B43BB99